VLEGSGPLAPVGPSPILLVVRDRLPPTIPRVTLVNEPSGEITLDWLVASAAFQEVWAHEGAIHELLVPVTIRHGRTTTVLTALVDTGASVPVLFRKGLFPSKENPAVRRVSLSTANGSPLEGGARGAILTISLPCMTGGVATTLVCKRCWCYEAGLPSTDMILGYPFLKALGLAVDTSADVLRCVEEPSCKTRENCHAVQQDETKLSIPQGGAVQQDVRKLSLPSCRTRENCPPGGAVLHDERKLSMPSCTTRQNCETVQDRMTPSSRTRENCNVLWEDKLSSPRLIADGGTPVTDHPGKTPGAPKISAGRATSAGDPEAVRENAPSRTVRKVNHDQAVLWSPTDQLVQHVQPPAERVMPAGLESRCECMAAQAEDKICHHQNCPYADEGPLVPVRRPCKVCTKGRR
jgi:hypothetical protein